MGFLGVFLFLIVGVAGVSYYFSDKTNLSNTLIERGALYFAYGNYEEEVEEESFAVAKNASLSIENINGPIKITGTKGTNAHIKITRRGSDKKDFDRISIEKNIDKNSINLKTIHSDHNRQKVSVGYELTVPLGISVAFSKTVNGSIFIADIEGNIKAHTVNGAITCHNTVGTVDAYSVNGALKIIVKSLNNKDVTLTAVNGSIDFLLLKSTSAQFEAQTAVGSIISDFDVTTDVSHITGKKIKGIIGKNIKPTAHITLTTTNGAIHIRKIDNEI